MRNFLRAGLFPASFARLCLAASATICLALALSAAAQTMQDAPVLTPSAHPKLELVPIDKSMRAKGPKPVTPSDTFKGPLPPDEAGCFHLVEKVWRKVPCATERKALGVAAVANSIQSTPHAMRGVTGGLQNMAAAIVRASVAVNIASPSSSTETDTNLGSNTFSIQLNTDPFPCSQCTSGYPWPASRPNDNGWVQFTYQQYGNVPGNQGGICVWYFDLTVWYARTGQSFENACVMTGSIPVAPLTGPGAPADAGEVVGYVTCPSSGNSCILHTLAYVPWAGGWWIVSAPDKVGLASNWKNASGTIYGWANGSQAVFTNARVEQVLHAYSCYVPPSSANNFQPQPCTPPRLQYLYGLHTITATPALVNGTGESNNLVNDPVTFSCGPSDCWLTYNSHVP